MKYVLLLLVAMAAAGSRERPTLYIIGDSTVKNGSGKGGGGLWGWGSLLDQYFDTTRIAVRNYALGGRSSRTFITEGHWDEVLRTLKAGDYVIMQFGHNDGGPLDDTARARGSIRGTGEETKEIYNPIMKKNETVHTYGWYMRKYLSDIKERGAVAIVCSPIPRNIFKEGKVARASEDYGLWAKQVAAAGGADLIDLNELIAKQYERLGADSVVRFFPGDHTHTNEAGAKLNAEMVVKGIETLGKNELRQYLRIDRHALVSRHDVVNRGMDTMSSLTLGNGRFAITVDGTGLQSFPEYYAGGVPLGTESEWGWHSFADTAGYRLEEAMQDYDAHGRMVRYAVQAKAPERARRAADWFRQNVHRLQLGCLGFEFVRKDGKRAKVGDIRQVDQRLDLWRGVVESSFVFEGVPVKVITVVHPGEDVVAVSVKSKLLSMGRISVRLRLPYPTGAFTDVGDNWGFADRHVSEIVRKPGGVMIGHVLDSTKYFIGVGGDVDVSQRARHDFRLAPRGLVDSLSFSCRFSLKEDVAVVAFGDVLAASESAWPSFWMSGAVVDFSGSTDPRAFELERRVVLSQYLVRVQEAGSQPPQETGLTYNSWFGKPHLEMHWWHSAHYALWGRSELMERSMEWYGRVAAGAREIAARQGYAGVRWQKMTDPQGRESPSSVGAFLIWQQPHFIYFAELCYRQHPDDATLAKYKDLVFATADFIASYPWYDSVGRRYVLGAPLIPAQERFAAATTFNPCYELAYWRWSLGVAQEWRRLLGMGEDVKWRKVMEGLSALPVDGGLYLPTESDRDAYTNERYRGDHPSVLGSLGFLPVTAGLDTARMRRTLDWVCAHWRWEDTWGWDFPMAAMTATRLGMPERAVDLLLMPVSKNRYLPNGHNYQDGRLRIYLPGNGGLLSAVALMCAGYDGSARVHPGIPDDGRWKVRWEGLNKMP